MPSRFGKPVLGCGSVRAETPKEPLYGGLARAGLPCGAAAKAA